MQNRRLESRFWTPDVVGEWEPATETTDTWGWKAAEFRAWVRERNAQARKAGESVQFRSVENEDAFA